MARKQSRDDGHREGGRERETEREREREGERVEPQTSKILLQRLLAAYASIISIVRNSQFIGAKASELYLPKSILLA